MNDILQLKGPFESRKNPNRPAAPTLPSNQSVCSNHIRKLGQDLLDIAAFWRAENFLPDVLLSAHYRKVAAKSNRIDSFLSYKDVTAEQTIVGAKYGGTPSDPYHIITHYVSIDAIVSSVEKANETAKILDEYFTGVATTSSFNSAERISLIDFSRYSISKTTFQRMVVDASFITKFAIDKSEFLTNETAIISFFDVKMKIDDLLRKFGINPTVIRALDNTSVLLGREEIELILRKAPYLVAMATVDFSRLLPTDFAPSSESTPGVIPSPKNEPIIGVIDTLFDSSVYFSDWVEHHNDISSEIPAQSSDYQHGTSVCSLLVDGPSLNPELNDGCGRFRVRHFGIALHAGFSSFTIINQIKTIISKNTEIHVWNISLGSDQEVNRNFISAEASVLDQIQYENDITFIISGTNKRADEPKKRIGAPADSVNAIVVNSVDSQNNPVNYSRSGPVLSFFTKPDVSYYGGDSHKRIRVCDHLGLSYVCGTSYAAPWISRKMAFLVDVLGFPREIAKALLIDAAIGWNETHSFEERSLKGHGVVPVRIDDIVKSEDDEIKFVVSGVSEQYETYSYQFAVPKYKNEYPFLTKATLCYFPRCSRNQGVDYTNTELDLYFGRIDEDNHIKSINNNKQCIEDNDIHPVYEADARKYYRKWDNIKHITDEIKERLIPRKAYQGKLWGMKVVTKERLKSRDGIGIRFGVVVTLKEIHGVNRIQDFISECSLRGWLVNRINVESRIQVYNKASEEIKFD
ncbi:MAG: S8 family peptidase [Candidatus Izemoplasmatales bacterium]